MRYVTIALMLSIVGAAAAARAADEAPAGQAKAEQTSQPADPAAGAAEASGAQAEMKAATGIENRLPTGEATTFPAGTLIYVWSQVTGAQGKHVEHVWKRDGKEFRRAKFSIGSPRWKMSSRMPSAKQGAYVVETVLGEEKLGEVSFTVE
jgi:hypothetical protein